MPKQRCGSCRFFQDAGLAGSGWCHHPLRKTTSDLLIMVRRNELACRDEWTRTLWEEGTFGDPAVMPAHPLDPATEVEIAALLRTGLESDDAAAADVVIGEARLVSDATPPWRLPAAGLPTTAPPPPPAASFDSRTAILRAREAYRERQKATERRQSPDLGSDADALSGIAIVDASDAPLPDISSVRAAARFTPDEPSLEAEAGLDEAIVEAPPPEPAWAEPAASIPAADAGTDIDWQEELASDRGLVAAVPDAAPDWEPAGASEPEPEPAVAFQWEAIPVEPLPEMPDAWTPAAPGWLVEPAAASEADWSPVRAETSEEAWWEPVAGAAASPVIEPEPDADGGWRGTPVWDEAWIAELARESARGEHWAEWDQNTEDEEPAALDPEPPARPIDGAGASFVGVGETDRVVDLPLAAVARFEIAPGVPRVCRTCRDFRPADGVDRGWCANQWAFTHRRLVDPEEPAPCESSIGSWWLPADELYIGDADISAHGLATPLLDRWLPGHVVAEPERKQS